MHFLPECPLDASSHCSKLDLLFKCKVWVCMSPSSSWFLTSPTINSDKFQSRAAVHVQEDIRASVDVLSPREVVQWWLLNARSPWLMERRRLFVECRTKRWEVLILSRRSFQREAGEMSQGNVQYRGYDTSKGFHPSIHPDSMLSSFVSCVWGFSQISPSVWEKAFKTSHGPASVIYSKFL